MAHIRSGIDSDILSGIPSGTAFSPEFSLACVRAQACPTASGAGGVRVQTCHTASGAGDMRASAASAASQEEEEEEEKMKEGRKEGDAT